MFLFPPCCSTPLLCCFPPRSYCLPCKSLVSSTLKLCFRNCFWLCVKFTPIVTDTDRRSSPQHKLGRSQKNRSTEKYTLLYNDAPLFHLPIFYNPNTVCSFRPRKTATDFPLFPLTLLGTLFGLGFHNHATNATAKWHTSLFL